MPDHRERPPAALAHGAVKSSDIERVRDEVTRAEDKTAQDDQASAARRRKRLRRRKAESEPDVEP